LPFTIAEGLAVKHQIPREIFLAKIQSQMTAGEKLRMQDSASKVGALLSIDPQKLSLTKLALYILSLSTIDRQQRRAELTSWLQLSSATTLDKQRRIEILHCNPVFNTNDYELKQLSPLIPTIGIREAEDLPTVLAFMRFADGRGNLGDLETYLMDRSNDILSRNISPTSWTRLWTFGIRSSQIVAD
jgi:hypothetical protein